MNKNLSRIFIVFLLITSITTNAQFVFNGFSHYNSEDIKGKKIDTIIVYNSYRIKQELYKFDKNGNILLKEFYRNSNEVERELYTYSENRNDKVSYNSLLPKNVKYFGSLYIDDTLKIDDLLLKDEYNKYSEANIEFYFNKNIICSYHLKNGIVLSKVKYEYKNDFLVRKIVKFIGQDSLINRYSYLSIPNNNWGIDYDVHEIKQGKLNSIKTFSNQSKLVGEVIFNREIPTEKYIYRYSEFGQLTNELMSIVNEDNIELINIEYTYDINHKLEKIEEFTDFNVKNTTYFIYGIDGLLESINNSSETFYFKYISKR